MRCIINGRLVLADKTAEGMAIVFGEKIERIAPQNELDLSQYEVIDAGGRYVAPGLVDIHIHGYLGEDVSDGTTEGIKKMAQAMMALVSELPAKLSRSSRGAIITIAGKLERM